MRFEHAVPITYDEEALLVFWISTGCGHNALNKITERGNGIINSWLDLLHP